LNEDEATKTNNAEHFPRRRKQTTKAFDLKGPLKEYKLHFRAREMTTFSTQKLRHETRAKEEERGAFLCRFRRSFTPERERENNESETLTSRATI
jgi:hypothetical protein